MTVKFTPMLYMQKLNRTLLTKSKDSDCPSIFFAGVTGYGSLLAISPYTLASVQTGAYGPEIILAILYGLVVRRTPWRL